MNDKWLNRYFDLAHHVSQWSRDTTKVGAVIVGQDRRNIAFGYNGPPPNVKDLPERLNDKEVKYKFTQHAERAALDHVQFSCQDATLVITMWPCSDCAKSIISKGIKTVVCPKPVDREPWASDSKFSEQMFEEAGIKVVYK